jgi:hypothetical protein
MIEVRPAPDAVLATPGQRELETRAVRVFNTERMQRALEAIYALAQQQPQAGLPAGAKTLRAALEEIVFAFVIRNLNANPLRPQILWDQHPPHRYGDWHVPGSRAIGNNPDNIYRRIPLDPGERYVLRGQLTGPPSPDITFSVLPHVSRQVDWQQTTLTLADIHVDTNGCFELTLNSDEATDGQHNHVHLAPGAIRMTIRESMTDWALDTPIQLKLTHEGQRRTKDGEHDPLTKPLVNEPVESLAEDLAARLPPFVGHWLTINNNAYFAHASNSLPNAERPPGGLVGQTSVMGNYALEADEVLVLRATTLGASYFSFALMDPWMRCADFENRTASLTTKQAAADQDGWYTVVIGLEDPGVHNWLDPGGLGEGALQIRWQGIPAAAPAGRFFQVRKARREQLKALLPKETVWVTADERAAQLAARSEAFKRRFTLQAPQVRG